MTVKKQVIHIAINAKVKLKRSRYIIKICIPLRYYVQFIPSTHMTFDNKYYKKVHVRPRKTMFSQISDFNKNQTLQFLNNTVVIV